MIYHKSCHKYGLDTMIYNKIKNIKTKKNYYFYIYDYCATKENIPNNFYNSLNNENNTWNYNLKFSSTSKENIMKDNIKFGFSNYYYTDNDEYILVKALDHKLSSSQYGQSHIVKRTTYEQNYDKNKYIGQKILKSNNNLNIELNIYVIRNLNNKKLNFFCILCFNNTKININRKKNKCVFKIVNINILKNKLKNFIDYVNYINLDYGRIELIYDQKLDWCIIDVNNSPGEGPISKMSVPYLSLIFYKIITN